MATCPTCGSIIHTSPFRIAEFEVFPTQRSILRHGAKVSLTTKDFDLACLLLRSVGSLLSRGYIYAQLWPDKNAARTLDTHICRVRHKLQLLPVHGWELTAVYRKGYRLTYKGAANGNKAI